MTEDELDAKVAKLFNGVVIEVKTVNGKSATKQPSTRWNGKKQHATWKKPVACFSLANANFSK